MKALNQESFHSLFAKHTAGASSLFLMFAAICYYAPDSIVAVLALFLHVMVGGYAAATAFATIMAPKLDHISGAKKAIDALVALSFVLLAIVVIIFVIFGLTVDTELYAPLAKHLMPSADNPKSLLGMATVLYALAVFAWIGGLAHVKACLNRLTA